jgi:hypothetical protein
MREQSLSLLYGFLKIVTRVTETCLCNKQNCTAERIRNLLHFLIATRILMHGMKHLKKDALFIVISTRHCVSQNAVL